MIQIMTDSMSDIQPEEARQYAVTVLPQPVLFGEETFLAGADMSVQQFYEKMAAEKVLPKTSQVSPDTFASAFSAALERGDEILYIGGSTTLSGCYQSAGIARDMQPPDAPIYLVDSRNVCVGQQVLIGEAVRLRDAGESVEAIVQHVSRLVERLCLVGRVDDLKHLVMGGRLSATTARIGVTLNLKPMLRLKEGKLVQDGLTRGKKRSFEWMKKQLEAEPRDTSMPLYLASACAGEELEELRAYLEAAGLTQGGVQMAQIGPIIGTHAGKGTLVMAWARQENAANTF